MLYVVHGDLNKDIQQDIKAIINKRCRGAEPRRFRTGWVTAELLMLGEWLGFNPYPEYPVQVNSRSGYGYVDVVWFRNGFPAVGFEISNGLGKARDVAKLRALPVGVIVQIGRRTGSPPKKNLAYMNPHRPPISWDRSNTY